MHHCLRCNASVMGEKPFLNFFVHWLALFFIIFIGTVGFLAAAGGLAGALAVGLLLPIILFLDFFLSAFIAYAITPHKCPYCLSPVKFSRHY